MMIELKPCPFCGNVNLELVDSRVEFFVRCNQCKPFFTVVYGKNVRHLDHINAETDEEADRLSEIEFNAVDWDEIKQSAIDAWNTRADGWIEQDKHSIFEISLGSCVLIMFKNDFNGITKDDNKTIDISWIRSGDKIHATTGYYLASDIVCWKSI